MNSKISVGFSRMVMNPTQPLPLTGFSNEPKRYYTAITEDICATCVAITDADDTTILIFQADFCTMTDAMGAKIRGMLQEATGVPDERIYAAATHTHAGPCIAKMELAGVPEYHKIIEEVVPKCGAAAMADRKAVTEVSTGSVEAYGLNFVKHYKARDLKTGEVSYIGDNFGTGEGKVLLEHATQADPTMHMVRFTRAGGKDVVLANFRAHPHTAGGSKKYDLSSDFVGGFREALDLAANCHTLYLQGASGNINSHSRFPAEKRWTTARSHGSALAAYATECLAFHMKPITVDKIKTKQFTFYGDINHSLDHMADEAWAFRAAWNKTFDWNLYREDALKLGIRSPYHAGAIKWNSERTTEVDGKLTLNAVALGDALAFVTFPGEMFDSVSVRMEENSPYKTTMMLGYCNQHIGYLPSAIAYKYTSYETDITRFQAGTGEKAADAYVEALKELKNR